MKTLSLEKIEKIEYKIYSIMYSILFISTITSLFYIGISFTYKIISNFDKFGVLGF